MMPGDFTEYASSFPVGGRVRVGIPLAGGGAFQEWGVVSSLERDLLGLELSRDALPQGASLILGNTLEVRFAEKEEERCCRGVLVGGATGGVLALRLVDGVVTFEPREYFRQDVYLPVDYRIPPHQNSVEIRERWRQGRRDQELAAQKPEPGEPAQLTAKREEIRSRLEQRCAALPAAANMSGGGVRFSIPERLEPGLLVYLTIYLPQPQKVLELVGEVVGVQPAPSGDGFITALRFRFIDEADRDRIVGYISGEQLAQLSRLGRGEPSALRTRGTGKGPRRLLILGLTLLLLTALVAYLTQAIIAKRERGEKHEIERIFEDGIAKILKQRK
jgi:hypothetical protein